MWSIPGELRSAWMTWWSRARTSCNLARDGKVEAAQTMVLTLGCDHRALDGAHGALFLKDLVEAIEDPSTV